jgi:hypothetical protein
MAESFLYMPNRPGTLQDREARATLYGPHRICVECDADRQPDPGHHKIEATALSMRSAERTWFDPLLRVIGQPSVGGRLLRDSLFFNEYIDFFLQMCYFMA